MPSRIGDDGAELICAVWWCWVGGVLCGASAIRRHHLVLEYCTVCTVRVPLEGGVCTVVGGATRTLLYSGLGIHLSEGEGWNSRLPSSSYVQ